MKPWAMDTLLDRDTFALMPRARLDALLCKRYAPTEYFCCPFQWPWTASLVLPYSSPSLVMLHYWPGMMRDSHWSVTAESPFCLSHSRSACQIVRYRNRPACRTSSSIHVRLLHCPFWRAAVAYVGTRPLLLVSAPTVFLPSCFSVSALTKEHPS